MWIKTEVYNDDSLIYLYFTGEDKRVPLYKVRLQKNYKNIILNIIHTRILDHLIEQEVLSPDDGESINNCPTRIMQNRMLVTFLIQSEEECYRKFLEALRDDEVYKELADGIENTNIKEDEVIMFRRFLL